MRALYKQGLEMLQDIERELTPENSIYNREVRARCLLERARMLRGLKENGKATTCAAAAWAIIDADDAFFDDDLVIDVLHLLALLQDNPKENITWNLRAYAMAKKSQHANAIKWISIIGDNLGWVCLEVGEVEASIKYFQMALEAREKLGDAECIRLAKWMVARAMRSNKLHKEAIAALKELESEYKSLGKVDGYVCEEIAENLHELGHDEDAKPYFKMAWQELLNDTLLCEHHPQHRLERLHELGE
ncbi:hypothetical protein THRCLA_08800 [Thraustotheca clavata]|uniref:Regulator of microtubule dynamics protein n=1 Tax=Thraustotheca clavata TaxID=74557 RepID=A0A1V9Z256_9STRA|nr:hypothetical protein THRCLA_08800 [Thraustotheca clavata]